MLNPGRGSRVTLALLVLIIVLGSIVGYQQLQISNLSRSLSHQSSEFANPTSSVKIANFTVSQFNSTARPWLYLVFTNNGTTPASNLESLLVVVYGANGNLQFCYNNTQNFFPLFSNESVMVFSALNCGKLGNDVVLTATVDFLSNHGATIKVYSARTTITQSQFSNPTMVVIKQVGIKTYMIPEIARDRTIYNWVFIMTNESPTSIVAINETATSARGGVFTSSSDCTLFGGGSKGPYVVSNTYPLSPHSSCGINNNLPPSLGPFILGDHLHITVGIRFANGTSSDVVTTAQIIPPYVPYQ